MSSSEQRRAARKHANDAIDVTDSITGDGLGRIGNISRDGMMLIGRRKLNDNAIYQFRFPLAGTDGKQHVLEAGVHEQWSEPAAVPGQYWAGLRIIALSEGDAVVLEEWLRNPEL